MKETRFKSLLRFFKLSPAAAPAPKALVAAPSGGSQLNQAVRSLNDEFVTLNFKLLELRDSLQNLRGALKELEDANRKRAETRMLPAPGRMDLN